MQRLGKRKIKAQRAKKTTSPGAKRRALVLPCGLARRRIRLAGPQKEVKESVTPCGVMGQSPVANYLVGIRKAKPYNEKKILYEFPNINSTTNLSCLIKLNGVLQN
jgi:hypothetical protein